MKSPIALAAVALLLALTTPAIVFVATKLGALAATATSIGAPLIALSILFEFAFHVRFALGALRTQQKAAGILATLAMIVGVSGFIGAVLVLMGIVR